MELIHVKGNTFCIDVGGSLLPLYKISEKEAILIDSGRPDKERELVQGALQENNISISGIISTHAHIDHVGNNGFLQRKYGSKIAMPLYEAGICQSLLTLKSLNNYYDLKSVKKLYGEMECKTDILISETDTQVEICDINFSVVQTPGHSPGHVCIVTPDNVAYLGDAILGKRVLRAAKLPFSFSLSQDLVSKRKLLNLKADKFIIAHKDICDDITELTFLNIKKIEDRAEVIAQIIDGEMTLNQILRAVTSKFNLRIDTQHKYFVIERHLRPFLDYLVEYKRLKTHYRDQEIFYIEYQ
ncbi:MAG: MBL fold metallo-hydrolase [Eubacteriaceae bacterium]|nr:MBL fold metallo-hydrolase [Eubacteriaceae bacterium]